MSLIQGDEDQEPIAAASEQVGTAVIIDGVAAIASSGASGIIDPRFRKFALVTPPEPDASAVEASNGGDILTSVARKVIKLLQEYPELQEFQEDDISRSGQIRLCIVRSAAAASDALAALAAASPPVIALDLEHHSAHSRRGFVPLLQVSSADTDYLFDTMEPEVRQVLSDSLDALLRAESPLKIFHGASHDVAWLATNFGARVGSSVVDTREIALSLGWEGLGLQVLVERALGIPMDKSEQCSDWRQRPLTEAQIMYARGDTRRLLPMATRLMALATGMATEPLTDPTASTAAALAPPGVSAVKATDSDDDDDSSDDDDDDDEGRNDGADASLCLGDDELHVPLRATRSQSSQEMETFPEMLLDSLQRSAKCMAKHIKFTEHLVAGASGPSKNLWAGVSSAIIVPVLMKSLPVVKATGEAAVIEVCRRIASRVLNPPLATAAALSVWHWREGRSIELDERLAEWSFTGRACGQLGVAAAGAWSALVLGVDIPSDPGALVRIWYELGGNAMSSISSDTALPATTAVADVLHTRAERICRSAAIAVSDWRDQWQHGRGVTQPDLMQEACDVVAVAVTSLMTASQTKLEASASAQLPVSREMWGVCMESIAATLPDSDTRRNPKALCNAVWAQLQSQITKPEALERLSSLGGASPVDGSMVIGAIEHYVSDLITQVRGAGAVSGGHTKSDQSGRGDRYSKANKSLKAGVRSTWDAEVRVVGAGADEVSDMRRLHAVAFVKTGEYEWVVSPEASLARVRYQSEQNAAESSAAAAESGAAAAESGAAAAESGAAAAESGAGVSGVSKPVLLKALTHDTLIAVQMVSEEEQEHRTRPKFSGMFTDGTCCMCGDAKRSVNRTNVWPTRLRAMLGPVVKAFNTHDRVLCCSGCAKTFKGKKIATFARLCREMGIPEVAKDMVTLAADLAGSDSAAFAGATALLEADDLFHVATMAFDSSLKRSQHGNNKKAAAAAVARTGSSHLTMDDSWGVSCLPDVRADGIFLTAASKLPADDAAFLSQSGTSLSPQDKALAAELVVRPTLLAAMRSVRQQRTELASVMGRDPSPRRCQMLWQWIGPVPDCADREHCDEYDWLSRHGPRSAMTSPTGSFTCSSEDDVIETLTAIRGFDITGMDMTARGARLADRSVIGEALVAAPRATLDMDATHTWSIATNATVPLDVDFESALATVDGANSMPVLSSALAILARSADGIGHLIELRATRQTIEKFRSNNRNPYGAGATKKRLKQKIQAQSQIKLLLPRVMALFEMYNVTAPDNTECLMVDQADCKDMEAAGELVACQRACLNALDTAINEAEKPAIALVVSLVSGEQGPSTQTPLHHVQPFGKYRRMSELLRFGPSAAHGLERLSPWFKEEMAVYDEEQEHTVGESGFSIAAERRVQKTISMFRQALLDGVHPAALPDEWSVEANALCPRSLWGSGMERARVNGWHPDLGFVLKPTEDE